MGMYTEIFLRGEIDKSAPQEVHNILHYLIGDIEQGPIDIPNHPFFETQRWEAIAGMTSAYFPEHPKSVLVKSDWGDHWNLVIHSNLKNYEGEIGKFFHWIEPYMEGHPGLVFGWEFYEEADIPILYAKKTFPPR